MTNRRIFIRHLSSGAIGFCIMPTLTFCKSNTEEKEPEIAENQSSLPRSTPEEQGISSETIINLINEIEKSEIQFHSLMIVHNGYVVAEGWWYPYAADLKHQLYSLSKSFTSTAVGLAVKEGLLTVEDQVISFFPDDQPEEISDYLRSMKVKHLLTMSVGHSEDTTGQLRNDPDGNWVKKFLSLPIANEPGSVFLYNTGATFMLSAIVQKVTGEKLIDYLQPRLFEPLHIEGMDWLENPQGINTGGYGLRVKTEDIAKLGQLYLQKGKWGDEQILTEEWVNEATTKRIDSKGSNPNDPPVTDWNQGYGYQFWMSQSGGFRADGAFGQFSLVSPDHNTVVSITEESFNTQRSMTLIWENLYPNLSNENLPENTENREKMTEILDGLRLSVPVMNATSPKEETINGKTFKLEENDLGAKAITISFSNQICTLNLEQEENDITIKCGQNEWNIGDNEKKTTQSLFPVPGRIDFPSKIAASYTWDDSENLIVTWRFIETVHGDQITCFFTDDSINIAFMNSAAKGSGNDDPRKDITGKMG
tara:strand:- start:38355 stop:39962 length:1608 start_codon:yes stop_codon:yes gene_type:complete